MERWVLGWGLLLSVLGTNTARAQGLDDWHGADQPKVRVVISAAPSVKLRVAEARSEHTVAVCEGRCVFEAEPGKYVVFTRNLETGADHEASMHVTGPSRFRLEEGDDSARTAGLVVGIVGPSLIFTGIILTAPALLSAGCHDTNCTSEGEATAAKVGLGAILIGAIATPVGWSIFASNRTRLQLVQEDRGSVPLLRLGLGCFAPGAFGLTGVAEF